MDFLRRCAESLIELENHKEVKKVNKIPYFELKVVKVKKEEKKQGGCKLYESKWCGECPRIPKQKKGNWVNGENIDKIKFPCFCSYNAGYAGIITKDGMNYYELHNIEQQADENYLGGRTLVAKELDLKILVKCWHIHILKGKLIIFEEE